MLGVFGLLAIIPTVIMNRWFGMRVWPKNDQIEEEADSVVLTVRLPK